MENSGTMVNDKNNRSDRIFIKKGSKFSVNKIELMGSEPLPMYKDQKSEEEEEESGIVTASDHLGLIASI